jgi:pyrimidine operon attenuation protein / uracil phosphoribosyltransferase
LQAREKIQLLSASELDRTLVRLTHEVLERTSPLDSLAFLGIRRAGVPIAQRLAQKLSDIEGLTIPVGGLDIRAFRDDQRAVDTAEAIEFDINGRDVVLVDDVLHTGRTVRAALDALFQQGRPSRVRLLVLIDRGHRELPIEAQFVGRSVQTKAAEIVEVRLAEIDGIDKVVLMERV